jgi:TonB family protein
MQSNSLPPLRTIAPERGKNLLVIAVAASLLLHTGGLLAAVRWGGCICHVSAVVCPKTCPISCIDMVLQAPKIPPKILTPPKLEDKCAAPAAKAGRVVLPDKAVQTAPPRPAEIKLDRPALAKAVVVKQSEASAPSIASAEIFDRAGSLTPGSQVSYGLGGTGSATSGPFGTDPKGTGTNPTPPPQPTSTAKVEPRQEPPTPIAPVHVETPPSPKPKGASQPPKVLNWTDPPYPPEARKQGVEGTVKLRVTVSAQGTAQAVAIAQSSGNAALDEAAVMHLQRARFAPALHDGNPIDSTIVFRVKFRLQVG